MSKGKRATENKQKDEFDTERQEEQEKNRREKEKKQEGDQTEDSERGRSLKMNVPFSALVTINKGIGSLGKYGYDLQDGL